MALSRDPHDIAVAFDDPQGSAARRRVTICSASKRKRPDGQLGDKRYSCGSRDSAISTS